MLASVGPYKKNNIEYECCIQERYRWCSYASGKMSTFFFIKKTYESNHAIGTSNSNIKTEMTHWKFLSSTHVKFEKCSINYARHNFPHTAAVLHTPGTFQQSVHDVAQCARCNVTYCLHARTARSKLIERIVSFIINCA